jgi:hypothetical protein
VSAAAVRTIPVSLDSYLAAIGATTSVDRDLQAGESGYSLSVNGVVRIGLNSAESLERQRFTVCHEIAHVVLKLPSDHSFMSESKRPPAEILCDAFAAELLLPFELFQPLAEDATVTLGSVEELASRFQASVTCTGSHFASVVSSPCAFVLSRGGRVRHAARSKPLEDSFAQIPFGAGVPRNSISERVRSGDPLGSGEIDADEWFHGWDRGGRLIEEARHLPEWNQTITLLRFADDQIPTAKVSKPQRWTEDEPRARDEDDELLPELDGQLRWPRSKRR